jgi:hypothetical protein
VAVFFSLPHIDGRVFIFREPLNKCRCHKGSFWVNFGVFLVYNGLPFAFIALLCALNAAHSILKNPLKFPPNTYSTFPVLIAFSPSHCE